VNNNYYCYFRIMGGIEHEYCE